MQAIPHLHFQGNCGEAFRLYADTLNGKVAFSMTFGESPMKEQVPKDFQDKIIHARIEFNGHALTGCDAPPGRYEAPRGFNVLVAVDNPNEAERVFGALARDGSIGMPMQQTFWAHRFGMCTDRFGVPWMVNCEKAP